MTKHGLFMREEAGGRLRISGRHASVATPGTQGSYRIILNDREPSRRLEAELSEETLDELEDIIAALRLARPSFEKERRSPSLVMKRFMLDNAMFPQWPAAEMADRYRAEGAFVERREILEWRMALARPESMRSMNAKLVLSVSRREISSYCDLLLGALADMAAEAEPEWYHSLGRALVLQRIEQSLVNAWPLDAHDRDAIVLEARNSALVKIFSEGQSTPELKQHAPEPKQQPEPEQQQEPDQQVA